jgi:hypothetical protein
MGISQIPKQEHADAKQHRQTQVPVSTHKNLHNRCKITIKKMSLQRFLSNNAKLSNKILSLHKIIL